MILSDAATDLPHWISPLLGGGGASVLVGVIWLLLTRKIVTRGELDEAIKREERAIRERDEGREIYKKAVDVAQEANETANKTLGLLNRLAGYVERGPDFAGDRGGGKR